MNWGKGITIAIICFMAFIIYLTVSMMMTKVDLESDDYYIREVAYEQEIDALKNGNEVPSLNISQQDESVIISIPDSTNITNVMVDFLRPSNDQLDKQFNFNQSKLLVVSKSELEIGMYNLEISFLNGEKKCLQKHKLYIK